jgi:hypothetical protein
MNDTAPMIDKKMREMIGAKDPIERLKMGCSMYHTSRYLIERAILEKNPSISKVDLKKEIFLIFYRDDFSPEECQRIIKHFDSLS